MAHTNEMLDTESKHVDKQLSNFLPTLVHEDKNEKGPKKCFHSFCARCIST